MTGTSTPVRWFRKNLLAGPMDSALTCMLIPLCIWALLSLGQWIFFDANWGSLMANMKVMMVGIFPLEMLPRAWSWFGCLCVLVGATLGTVAPISRRFLAIAALIVLPLTVVAASRGASDAVSLFACLTGGGLAQFATGRLPGLRRYLGAFWLFGVLATGFLLLPAGIDRWGGLMLGLLVTLVAAALSIPLGFALAFGRRSTMAGIRVVCISYIEVMRSLPLILIVYGIWVVTPLIVRDIAVPDVVRGILGFTLFFAAYVAEYVRSGLQSVAKGQIEAAASLGLTRGQINRDVVLPQALRVVTPALVGNVLDIFNNVPLLFIIGLTEFLRAGQMILANPQSSNQTYEVYAFMFVVYLAAASLITYGARRLEKRMNTGYR